MIQRSLVILVLLIVAVPAASSAPALPYAWTFSSGILKEPVTIVGWEYSERIMQGLSIVDSSPGIDDRPAFFVATFGESQWEAATADGVVRSSELPHHFSLYRASEKNPAMLVGAKTTRSLSNEVVSLLRSRGIDLR